MNTEKNDLKNRVFNGKTWCQFQLEAFSLDRHSNVNEWRITELCCVYMHFKSEKMLIYTDECQFIVTLSGKLHKIW